MTEPPVPWSPDRCDDEVAETIVVWNGTVAWIPERGPVTQPRPAPVPRPTRERSPPGARPTPAEGATSAADG